MKNKYVDTPDMLPRLFFHPDGRKQSKLIHICNCPTTEKKGAKGGCCGKCGYAIPDETEEILFKTK